jgi:hypothetical protein
MRELVGYVDGLSNQGGSEQRIRAAIAAGRERPVPAWQHHLGAVFGGEALRRVGLLPGRDGPAQPPEVADGLVRTCRTAATSGCWSSSTPGAPRRVGRGSGPPAPPAGRGQAPGQQHQAGRPVAPPPPGQGPRNRWLLADREEAALVTRSPMARTRGIMHQFPPAPSGSSATARAPRRRCGTSPQYLEQLVASGTQPGELAVIPAAGPAPHLAAAGPGDGPDRLADLLDQPRLAGQPSPHQGGGSWTGELSWVGGDDQVLSPWRASWLVHQQIRLRGPCRRPPPPPGAVPAAGRPEQPLLLMGRGCLDQPRHRTGPSHHPA